MRGNEKAVPSGANAENGNGMTAAGGCNIVPASVLYHCRSAKARNNSRLNVFDEVKNRVPVQDVAELYGFRANRAGFICCPLHGEKTPSFRIRIHKRLSNV